MCELDYVSYAPLRERFGTNYSPSRWELAEIESFLPSPRRQLMELSAKIDELRAQQAALKEVVDSLEALRGPINRIPLKILQEIFRHCLLTHHLDLPTLNNSEAPLLLTHICHPWRTVCPGSGSMSESYSPGEARRTLTPTAVASNVGLPTQGRT